MNIPLFKVFIAPAEEMMPRLQEVIYSGQISEGKPVVDFELKFAEFFGIDQVLSFYSGTAALHTALLMAGVQAGDEVISTAMTAEPTNMAILHANGKVVWADVDPRNGNLTAEAIAAKISERTKAIMVVHYGGIPAELKAIRKVAEKNQIPVIEDAAHAFGAKYDGKFIGNHSEYVMFSLQAIKHMTTVDGGMLACNRIDDLAEGRLIRWFGIDRLASRTDVDIRRVGYKYHMNNVTATIGLVQLPHMQFVIQGHIDNGKFFDRTLQGIDGLELCTWDLDAEPSYWFYTVLVDRREDFSRHLTANGIANSQAHKRNDWHSLFADSRTELPGLDSFYARMIHLPCGWWVTQEEREYIVEVIKKGW
jgi:perosamine synthetase